MKSSILEEVPGYLNEKLLATMKIDHSVDDNKVWEELSIPVDKPFIAIIVNKHILVDV